MKLQRFQVASFANEKLMDKFIMFLSNRRVLCWKHYSVHFYIAMKMHFQWSCLQKKLKVTENMPPTHSLMFAGIIGLCVVIPTVNLMIWWNVLLMTSEAEFLLITSSLVWLPQYVTAFTGWRSHARHV